MSTPKSEQVKDVLDRVLKAHARHTAVELAASLGVVDSYVSKLRSGWRPKRVRPELWQRLKSLDPARRAAVHEEALVAYGSDASAYARSVLSIIERSARAIAENAAEAQQVLSTGRPAVSPTADDVEAGAALLESLSHKPAQRKRRA